jgi:chemotaxis protein MotB
MSGKEPKNSRVNRANASIRLAEHRDRWLVSYSDLVTLLFALFVVLYAAADQTRARLIAQAVALEMGESRMVDSANLNGGEGVLPEHEALLASVRGAIEKAVANNKSLMERARIRTTERGIVVSLAEAGFFAPGDASVRQDAKELIDGIATALRETDAPVRIEGHTDSFPISNTRFPSNWELSAARAATVLARLVDAGIPSSRLAVAGYGGERPIATNATPEGRALNRRVDIVILKTDN